MAGVLAAQHMQFVSPELMFFETSGNAVITVIVGGVGTLVGPVVGSLAEQGQAISDALDELLTRSWG